VATGARRCDHDPARPRLELLVPIARDLPKLNRDAIERAQNFYNKPGRFPEITGAHLAPGLRVRKRRTSRLEALALVAAELARRGDQRTMRVGMPRPGHDDLVIGHAVKEICKSTGLSPTRAARALGELERAKYTSTSQPVVELAKPRPRRAPRRGLQTHVGLPAVRVLTPLFWQRLGFTAGKIKKARDRAAERWRERRARPVSPTALFGLAKARRQIHRVAPAAGPPEGFEEAQRLRLLRLQVHSEHPDWPPASVAAEALRRSKP